MIIAEIGTSHGGSLEKAKKMTDAACDAGADYIKFQWVYANEILHPDTGLVALPSGTIPLYERFRQLECAPEFYRELVSYVHKKGKKFICSPFGLKSLEELLSLQPDAVKIASPELNHYPLLSALAGFRSSKPEKIPVILSTGVSTLSDIEKALSILGTQNVTLLHCITSYPAPEEEYNLELIPNLSRIFGVPCGVSDHSLDPVLVPALSIACSGSVIEKHITLSKASDGLDDPVALEAEQFALMCHAVRQAEAAMRHYGSKTGKERIIQQLSEQFGKERVTAVLGTGVKALAPSEKANYGRTNRSLHYMNAFSENHVISPGDIEVLRTEKKLSPGISPEYLHALAGKKLAKPVAGGSGVQFEDFMN